MEDALAVETPAEDAGKGMTRCREPLRCRSWWRREVLAEEGPAERS